MIKNKIHSQWKRAQKTLKQAQFFSASTLNVEFLKDFVRQEVKSYTHLSDFLNAFKNTPLSSICTFKTVLFLHSYLQTKKQLCEQPLYSFFNYLLQLSASSAIMHTEQQQTLHAKTTSITQSTTRAEEVPFGHQTLFRSILKTYVRYLLKAVTMRNSHQGQQLQNHDIWSIINLLKILSGLAPSIVTIGRYFLRELGEIVILLVEMVNQDVISLMGKINRYVVQKNYLLSCSKDQQQLCEFVEILNEVGGLSETFKEIYLGKYFFKYLAHLTLPQWTNVHSHQFDTVYKLAAAQIKQK